MPVAARKPTSTFSFRNLVKKEGSESEEEETPVQERTLHTESGEEIIETVGADKKESDDFDSDEEAEAITGLLKAEVKEEVQKCFDI